MERQRLHQRTTTSWDSFSFGSGFKEEEHLEDKANSTGQFTATKEKCPERTNPKKRGILIADDDDNFRKALGAALYQYEVGYASNVPELLRQYHAGNYSLILTDNQMGKTYLESGLYAIHVIRSYDKKTPIFLMTADLTEEVRKEAEEMGVNEMFKKPVNLKDLIGKIRQYVN